MKIVHPLSSERNEAVRDNGKRGYLKRKLPPKLFKPRRVGGCVSHGVLNVPVSKIVLDQARVRALVGQGEPAGVPQHVRMSGQGKGCHFSIALDRNPGGFTAQRPAPLTHKK